MSGGGVPANTSSTTTVNQSPWQNKTYRTLALGTPENLGPVAQQLKIGQQLTQDWMDIQSGRNPGLYYGLQNATPERLAQENALRNVGFAAGRAPAPTAPTPTPTDTPVAEAAQGGIMNLRGFAPGGTSRAKPKPKPAALARPEADKNESGLTAAQQKQWDNLETLRNSGKKMTQQQIKAYNNLKSVRTAATTAAAADPAKQNKPTGAPFSFSDLETPTAFLDPKTGQNMLADAQLAYQKARELGTPEQIGQATQAYNDAVAGLSKMTNYKADTVAADKVSGAAMQGREAQAAAMQAASMQAAQANRGDIRDIKAIQADVERYQAAGMQAPPALQAEMYEAAQAQAAQMAGPERVEGQTYQAAQIAPTQREAAATTTGPKSWTDAGVAQQYMNPYAQAVINQNVQEANRNFQKNLSALRGQAAKSKAYGGSRQGLEEAEALRNQGYLLADIQDKGLSQAYTQGMGQFQAEQGLGSQVGMSNTQAINQLKSQYMQMGLTEAQANQAAQNQAAQYSTSNLQQAAMANQQAGLTAGQANLTAAQQTVLANQQALNNQRSLYVQQALDAAKTSYGGELTAAQQNQIAQNAASQFNAQSQNTSYNNYVQQQLAAQQANQAMDWNAVNLNTQNQQAANMTNAQLQQQAAQLNAQNQQQAELANQQYGLGGFQSNLNNAQFNQQANLANQQAALQAAQANQNAGLQANQQNLGAWGQVGNMAQGLGGLGATQNQIQLNNLGALGQSATAQTNYAQGALDRQTNNALNYFNLPSTFNAAGINALNAQPVSGGTNTSNQWYNQAKPFAKGGKVKWGPKK